MRSLLLTAVAAAVLVTAAVSSVQAQEGGAASAAPLMDAMFQDHSVLQRDRPVAVWGRAAPGAAVSVTLGETQARAVAGADGMWRANLPALQAGGPYTLVARTEIGRASCRERVFTAV